MKYNFARIGGVKSVVFLSGKLFLTRLEMIALEAKMFQAELVKTLLQLACALLSIFASIVLFSMHIIQVLTNHLDTGWLAFFSILLLIAGVVLMTFVMLKVRRQRPPFSDSISEMKKDWSSIWGEAGHEFAKENG